MQTLDQRIKKDLTERFYGKPIEGATILHDLASFSTKGLPGYYCGNRDAQTVFVQLNPGINADLADAKWDFDTKYFNRDSVESFIRDYKNSIKDGAKNDRMRFDAFDVKQAAFLYNWPNSGINFPKIDWTPKTDKDKYIKTVAWLEAKEIVLREKLQLELVPYASNVFTINDDHLNLLQPYIETILDEIFRVERTYVIFGSSIFEELFKLYNQEHHDTFVDLTSKQSVPLKNIKKKDGSAWTTQLNYKVIGINYNGKKQKALIAHTFPKQNLGIAFNVMQKYGKKCWEAFNKASF